MVRNGSGRFGRLDQLRAGTVSSGVERPGSYCGAWHDAHVQWLPFVGRQLFRTLALAFLLVVPCRQAWATSQFPERIRIAGREYELLTAPWEPWLAVHPICHAWLEPTSSALWRGYRGTWALRAGRLYLLALDGEPWRTHTPTMPGAVDRGMPLESFFRTKGPVWAEWYTGPLEVSLGLLAKPGEETSQAVDRVVEIWIDRGWVRGSWTVSESRPRWYREIRAPWAPPWGPSTEWSWLDARTIVNSRFGNCLAGERPVRVRGLLARRRLSTWCIEAPSRPGETTPCLAVSARVGGLGDGVPTGTPIEVVGHVRGRGANKILFADEVRALGAEASLEHDAWRDWMAWRPVRHPFIWREGGQEIIDSEDEELDVLVGSGLELGGILSIENGVGLLRGVAVAPVPELVGTKVWARGALQKWVVEHDTDLAQLGVLRRLATKRPLVLWSLVDVYGQKLATPRP